MESEWEERMQSNAIQLYAWRGQCFSKLIHGKHTFKESNGIHERLKCIELKYKKLDKNIEVYMHNGI